MQNEFDNNSVETKSISSLFLNYQIGREQTKHEFEFQEVCEDLQKDFGKLVWTIPYKNKPWVTEHNLRKAGEIARKQGITNVPYLIGIMKRL